MRCNIWRIGIIRQGRTSTTEHHPTDGRWRRKGIGNCSTKSSSSRKKSHCQVRLRYKIPSSAIESTCLASLSHCCRKPPYLHKHESSVVDTVAVVAVLACLDCANGGLPPDRSLRRPHRLGLGGQHPPRTAADASPPSPPSPSRLFNG
jgi:hypothetical protein